MGTQEHERVDFENELSVFNASEEAMSECVLEAGNLEIEQRRMNLLQSYSKANSDLSRFGATENESHEDFERQLVNFSRPRNRPMAAIRIGYAKG